MSNLRWDTVMKMYSLRHLPRKQRLLHVDPLTSKCYSHWKRLNEKLGRAPYWRELAASMEVSGLSTLSNCICRLRMAGLIPDPHGIIPDSVQWRDVLARTIDMLGYWAEKHPNDNLTPGTIDLLRQVTLPAVMVEDTPSWFRKLQAALLKEKSAEQSRFAPWLMRRRKYGKRK